MVKLNLHPCISTLITIPKNSYVFSVLYAFIVSISLSLSSDVCFRF